MDYDGAAPFPLDDYREMQRAIPGIDGLYLGARAILESTLGQEARVLVVGAGGGREIETLGRSSHSFHIVAVDPSEKMLAMAAEHAAAPGLLGQVELLHGEVTDVAVSSPFDAATSLLVMHFLPDDGTKEAYLRAIRARLTPGAPLLLADVSVDDRENFERMTLAFLAHAELNGLARDKAAVGPKTIAALPVVSEARTRALLATAGFTQVTPFFRGLWYAGWWCTAS